MPETLVSCEHGGNLIPAHYRPLFAGREPLLNSHRGYDLGALSLARALAAKMGGRLHYSRISRLLVDLNRSPHHREVFSEITRPLPREVRALILQRFHASYRNRVISTMHDMLDTCDHIVHLSAHSFVPQLGGVTRNADIGLLYDPGRSGEAVICRAARRALAERGFRTRLNYPYRGTADGFTTHLRSRFATRYSGIELELNQAMVNGRDWARHRRVIVEVISAMPDLLAAPPRRQAYAPQHQPE